MRDACLIMVDIQNDFMPGGALAVPQGDEIVPLANRLATRFEWVVAAQDWHPAGHTSFASAHAGRKPFETTRLSYGEQVLWPDHCVQGGEGAAFHRELALERVQLIVADTGVGVPDRDKIRIFEPYFSTKRGGTGLGLAIVNSIVAEHQGFLRVEDNVPQGTKFIIYLPMYRADYAGTALSS